MVMKRGPRYEAYSQLRETKLRMKHMRQQEYQEEEEEEPKIPTPPKKQVRFQYQYQPARITKGSSLLAQSVPDFSAALRKENRKPVVNTVMELTPPTLKTKRGSGGVLSTSRGTRSVNNPGEKRRVGGGGGGGDGSVLVARKSYANIAEIRGGGGRMMF